jgi:hypothetical protein
MRITYLYSEDINTTSGVYHKIQDQTSYWKTSGHDVQILSIFPTVVSKNPLMKLINYEKEVRNKTKEIRLFNPDLIYSRQLFFSFCLYTFLKKFKYVTEINTNDIVEKKYGNKLLYLYHLLTRKYLLSIADGFVFMTNELSKSNSFPKKSQITVIPNGINVNAIPFSNTEKHTGKVKVGFIGTPNQPWQALDKIIYLVKHCPEFNFEIVGPSSENLSAIDKNYNSSNNITVHGLVPQNESFKIMLKCDVALGTLGLHRKKLEENPPLKTRLYLAMGLPIILGYNDSDFLNEHVPFVLRIPNKEDNVVNNLFNIKTFISQVRNLDRKKIRDFAKEKLDTSLKESLRLAFFKKIITLKKYEK